MGWDSSTRVEQLDVRLTGTEVGAGSVAGRLRNRGSTNQLKEIFMLGPSLSLMHDPSMSLMNCS